jgi:16S rRNA (guanine527-N7)-methyltransferase
LSKEKIIDKFSLTPEQSYKIDQYIYEIKEFNKHTNIVGKSTLVDPWNSHVSDSIQICNHIDNKQSTILDMGTGAGIPGLILAVNNFTEVSLIDSNLKKIRFVKNVSSKLNIKVNIYHNRIESLGNIKFDYLVSRALASLSELFFYSQKLLDNKTILIFLKGKQVKDEINEASKHWKFHHELYKSISDKRGNIVVIRGLNKING